MIVTPFKSQSVFLLSDAKTQLSPNKWAVGANDIFKQSTKAWANYAKRVKHLQLEHYKNYMQMTLHNINLKKVMI